MRKQELHPRTAVINKSQKTKSRQNRQIALQWLTEKFPEAFNNEIRIRPLKKGIMNDILKYSDEAAQAGISKSKLREAVVLFTRRIDYLTCLKAQENRIDLEGNKIEKVSAEDAERAAVKIRKRVEKSARNAKKSTTIKSSVSHPALQQYNNNGHNTSKNSSNHSRKNSQEGEDFGNNQFPVYPPRSSAYLNTNSAAQTPKQASVIIKRKSAKPYDPNAVARLKEKLGLSSKSDKKQESVD